MVQFRCKKSNMILLVGLNGARKITLFIQVKDGTIHQEIVTSIEPNERSFVLRSRTTI